MILVDDDSGKDIQCTILFYFDTDLIRGTKERYVVFTDHQEDETGGYRILARIQRKNRLIEIQSEEEYQLVESAIQEWKKATKDYGGNRKENNGEY